MSIATPCTTLTLAELERIARDLNPALADLIGQILTVETEGMTVRLDMRLLNLTTA